MKIYCRRWVGILLIAGSTTIHAEDDSLARGEYLALAADCRSCHTNSEDKPYAGGVRLETPAGAVYSTNITPDRRTGIGDYSLEAFGRALREGVAKSGHNLYPVMPYTSYVNFDDGQIADLYRYFMQGVPAVSQTNRGNEMRWPLSLRGAIGVWNLLFRSPQTWQNDPTRSEEWNRGAWLVQGPGHCGSCHTPRGFAFQEAARDQSDRRYLNGGRVDGWSASSLTADVATGMGGWGVQDIADFLQSGQNDRSMAFGKMSEVVQQSTQYLSRSDIKAIAVYLKSLVADPPADIPVTTAVRSPERDTGLHDNAVGEALYADNCAACHRSNGRGYKRTYPPLVNNPALLGDPSSLIMIILQGSRAPATRSAPTGMRMPAFGWRLSNGQIAELSTFVRDSWGNHATEVTPKQVEALRQR